MVQTRFNKPSLVNKGTHSVKLNASSGLTEYRVLAFLAAAACFTAFVNAALQQLQMSLLGGQILFGNSVIKAALLATVMLGFIFRPTIKVTAIPLTIWLLCIGFLIIETLYLNLACGLSPKDVLLSYYDYYFLLLIGPAILVFRGAVSEKLLIRCSIIIFLICAVLAAAQYITSSPILHTESVDGSFKIQSWNFIGEVRAFSLFGSALEFGLFCAFSGALGVALTRSMPIRGTLLVVAAALSCYTTLTRLCYLVFLCACTYSMVLTFGKKPSRGRWHPLLYFVLGITTIIIGVFEFTSGESNKLQDAGSIFDRLTQWAYYYDLLLHSSLTHQLFGLGIVQNDAIIPLFPMIIDNAALALILHIGIVGFMLFAFLLVKMWLYLRREALDLRQPFIIAVTSLWATFACAGTFNILFSFFGTAFALAILCENKNSYCMDSEATQTK